LSSQALETPPEGLNHDDLAVSLLQKMQVGWSMVNAIAASEALKLKALQPGWTVPKAFTFIVQMWFNYKASADYRSPYRRKAATWLTESDYDNPQTWGGAPILAYQEKPKKLSEVELWRGDKELHPEKYPSPEETREFLGKLGELLEKKRMPDETPALLKQKVASNSSTVGSRHTLEIPKNNGPER
jgi:hypothetical protein